MDAIQSRIKTIIKARGGFLSRIPCFRARNPRYMKNEAIAPGWMEKGSQVTFELAHPTAAMRHTVSNGYLVLSARRVKPVEKKRAQRNHSRPIWRIPWQYRYSRYVVLQVYSGLRWTKGNSMRLPQTMSHSFRSVRILTMISKWGMHCHEEETIESLLLNETTK